MNTTKNAFTSTLYAILLASLILSCLGAAMMMAPVLIVIYSMSEGVKVFNQKQGDEK